MLSPFEARFLVRHIANKYQPQPRDHGTVLATAFLLSTTTTSHILLGTGIRIRKIHNPLVIVFLGLTTAAASTPVRFGPRALRGAVLI